MGKNVGVIGHGLMGKGITHSFASKGYNVFLFGRRDNAGDEMRKYLEYEYRKNRISGDEFNEILKRIRFCDLNNGLALLHEMDLIIETIKEDKENKINLFKMISEYLREDTIVATNTSTISITELGAEIDNPERFIGMHFFSPVPLMEIVEIVRGLRTSDETVKKSENILRSISKEPFIVEDTPGFVFNRMLVPMINEAAILYFENYEGNPKVVDDIMKKGLNLRFGPLELADLTGIDVIYHSMKSIYESNLDPKYKPCLKMKKMVDAGFVGRKAGRGFYAYGNTFMNV